jgi:murein DD-endopeptidase MepM/ murein hydrolase activator NlpD
MFGKKSWVLVASILLGLLLASVSLTYTSKIPRAFAASNPAPTLRLPYNGSFPIAGYSYGCGDHTDSRNNGNYDDSYAIDFGTPLNTPVVAATDGIVRVASMSGGIGNYVYVENTLSDHTTLSGYVTEYGHLNNNHVIASGTWVPQGTVIGYSGSTGNSSGPHLHFVLRAGYNGHNLFGNSQTGAYSVIPEPMSGYRGFKYYGFTSVRGGAPNNCVAVDTTTKFSSSNSVQRQTLLAMEFPLLGISYRNGDNNNPKTNWDWVNVQVYDLTNRQVANIWNNDVYNYIPGAFIDYADLGSNFPSGTYYARIRMNNTLGQYVYGINIVQGRETFVPLSTIQVGGINTIRGGDIDNNNQIDLQDYNDLLSCYGNKSCNFHQQSDLNRDGNVDGTDYNTWLRYYQGH